MRRGFADRADGGAAVASLLADLRGGDVVVLGLPRGGVPVAAVVAEALDAPLDVLLVRKIGSPAQRELAIGALAEDGTLVRNDDVIRAVGATEAQVAASTERARSELAQQAARWRAGTPAEPVTGRTVVVVDDGVATGATLRAALGLLRAQGAATVVAATPVAAPDSWQLVSAEADRAECPLLPWPFDAVGRWYDRFDQTPDDEVRRLLEGARRRRS